MPLRKPPIDENDVSAWVWKKWFQDLRAEVTAAAAGAPVDAEYVTMSNNATLTGERVLTAGSDISIADGGANGTVTISANPATLSPILQISEAKIHPFFARPIAGASTSDLHQWTQSVTGNTSVAVATTNYLTQQRRMQIVCGNTATSTSRYLNTQKYLWRGNASGLGGFYCMWRIGISTFTSPNTTLVGVGAATINDDLNPSTQLNCVLLANDTTETTLSVMHNDGAGTCTKVSLGASYPCALSDDVYRFEVYCAPASDSITYKVTKEKANISTSGTLSTNLPASNVFLGPISWNAARTTGGTGPVYDVVHVYGYTYSPN